MFRPDFGLLGYSLERTVVPAHLQTQLILLAHKGHPSSHFGVHATYSSLRKRFYWDGMFKDTVVALRACPCDLAKAWKIKPGLMMPVRTQATRPFQFVAMDLAGPLPTTQKGFRYFLLIVDLFSGWVELVPLQAITAEVVQAAFVENWINRYGVPEIVITDNGGQFVGDLALATLTKLGAEKRTTSAYHPQGNGVAERFIGSVKSIIRRNVCAGESDRDWDLLLPTAAFAMRVLERQDRPSAAEVLFGTQLRTAFINPPAIPYDEMILRRREVWTKVRDEVTAKVRKYEARFNASRVESPFELNQLVVLRLAFESKPFAPLFTGPYRIVEIVSPLNVRLRNVDGSKPRFKDVVHLSRLKPFFGVQEREEETEILSEVPLLEEEEEEEEKEEEWSFLFNEPHPGNQNLEVDSDPDSADADAADDADNDLPVDRWPDAKSLNRAQMEDQLRANDVYFGSRSSAGDIRGLYEHHASIAKEYAAFNAILAGEPCRDGASWI
jgi:transposase InsO family protein